MFAPSFASARGAKSQASAYSMVGLETGTGAASPHKLIEMLFQGFADALARARGALASGQMEAKAKAIRHAALIVEEGLKAGLNLAEGGAMAADLNAVYAYVGARLTHANLHNDIEALDECQRLMDPIHSAWVEIGSSAAAQ